MPDSSQLLDFLDPLSMTLFVVHRHQLREALLCSSEVGPGPSCGQGDLKSTLILQKYHASFYHCLRPRYCSSNSHFQSGEPAILKSIHLGQACSCSGGSHFPPDPSPTFPSCLPGQSDSVHSTGFAKPICAGFRRSLVLLLWPFLPLLVVHLCRRPSCPGLRSLWLGMRSRLLASEL